MAPNGWHVMETSPVLPAPSAPPPRPMIWKGGQPSTSTTSFKCLCYNVLAQIYATRQLYPYCSVWALAWNYRKNTLLREILSHNADIINLQEVQANHFDKFFLPNLSRAGYDGIFKRKNRETVRENPNAIDGCAIFYKRDRSHTTRSLLTPCLLPPAPAPYLSLLLTCDVM
jgi:CCR4-NOT transcription complex subunit 6